MGIKLEVERLTETLSGEWISPSLPEPGTQEIPEFTGSRFLSEPVTSCFIQSKHTVVAKVKPITETTRSQCPSNTYSPGVTSE